jgi:Holliday junction resolvase-like predicted endonuclease
MKEKKEKTEKRKTGDIGEKIAGRFLVSKGFEIVDWNYLKPWGEIDIIAKKKEKIHFVEVKTVSVDSRWTWVSDPGRNVSDGVRDPRPAEGFLNKCKTFLSDTLSQPEVAYDIREVSSDSENHVDEYRPEDNLHPWKLKRLKRAITSYLSEKRMSEEDDWQFDAVTVRIEEKGKTAFVEYLEDIIL